MIGSLDFARDFTVQAVLYVNTKSKATNHLKVHLSKVVVPYHKMSHSWTSSSSQCQVTSSRNAFHWRLWRRHKILTLLTRGCCCCLRRDSPETKAKAGGGVMAAAAAAAASTCTYTRLALLPWRCYSIVSGWEFNGSLKGCLQEHKCHSQTTLLPPKWSLVAAKYYDGRTDGGSQAGR